MGELTQRLKLIHNDNKCNASWIPQPKYTTKNSFIVYNRDVVLLRRALRSHLAKYEFMSKNARSITLKIV